MVDKMVFSVACFIYLFSCHVGGALTTLSTIDVHTKIGTVRGLNVSIDNQQVIQFRKIPYAKPPVHSLRFQKPQPITSWDGTLDATEYGPVCPQRLSRSYKKILENTNVSEDCLHLNIYIPHGIDTESPKPVMVYIHGGGYYKKSATLYGGSRLALNGDVIVILINYRLGMFGFMSTEDDTAKGNYGLWDQIEALKWIQTYISDFGGSPRQVTVFGHSAGGYSIGLLTLAPVTKGLFQKAICMSGFGTSERSVTHGAKNTTKRLAKHLGCLNESAEYDNVETYNIVACIKNRSTSDILKATSAIQSENSDDMSFIMSPAPVIDNEIVLGVPKNLLSDVSSESFKRFMSIDYMAGTNDADGWLLRSRISGDVRLKNYTSNGISTDAFCNIVIPRLSKDYFYSNNKFSTAVCNEYKDESSFTKQGVKSVEMYGDMMYASEAERTLRSHAKHSSSSSYKFLFTHEPSFDIPSSLPPWLQGANHGFEVPFIFQMPVYNYSQDELNLNRAMMTYLTNFAKFGNPNGNGTNNVTILPIWKEFDAETGSYINFNLNVAVGEHLYKERMDFWLDSIPQILFPKPTTPNSGISAASTFVGFLSSNCVLFVYTVAFFIFINHI